MLYSLSPSYLPIWIIYYWSLDLFFNLNLYRLYFNFRLNIYFRLNNILWLSVD